MKKIFLLGAFLFLNCSSDKEDQILNPEQKLTNKIDLKINGKKLIENFIDVSSFYMCDEKIYINVKSLKNGIVSELLTIVLLSNGELVYTNFIDKSSSTNSVFSTADFIPNSTINIEDFQFIENKKLKLKLSGTLLKRINNINAISETLQIDGTIEINNFGKTNCNIFNDFIKLNEQIKFLDIQRSYQDSQTNLIVSYESNSLNGFNIKFKNLTNFLQNMQIGTYTFNNLSSTEKIEFRKYIGILKNFGAHHYIPTDWKVYSTNGSFTIVEKTRINGRQVVKVKLNFSASYDGIVEYNFTNSEFETTL